MVPTYLAFFASDVLHGEQREFRLQQTLLPLLLDSSDS